ncbi:MAG: hypothetical protein Q7J35_00885 [Candidatus Methanoperedens sp.]|nr:hypothetical protein [Candidatus Methanoperedens sp.]
MLSNIFLSNFVFDKPLKEVDFFKIEGVVRRGRYEQMGKVIYDIMRGEGVIFAKYFPSPDENYVVGFLPGKPKNSSYSVGTMTASYEGKKDLQPTNAGKRTLLEYIYESQRRYLLQRWYWKFSWDTMFPIRWEKVDDFCLFRGPYFHYYFLDNRLALVLDTKTHYMTYPYLIYEINRKGRDLKWFEEELKEEKERMEERGKGSKGFWFYYDLLKKSIPIDGVDPTPISKKIMESEINGKHWKGTVAEYLRIRYAGNKLIENLDESQPGLLGGKYTYAPQFLRRHIDLEQVPNNIKNQYTFLIDTQRDSSKKNIHKPAEKRWEFIQNEIKKFQGISLGEMKIDFSEVLTAPGSRFQKPKLMTKYNGNGILPEEINKALKDGPYKTPPIDEILTFSIDDELRKPFWDIVSGYFFNNFGWKPPDKITPLEIDLTKLAKYIENRKKMGLLQAAALAIIEDNSNQHTELNQIFGNYKVPLQCVTESTATAIINGKYQYRLEGICAGLFVKSGGIPWLLQSPLNYDRYIAVDVGREKSTYWAMGIVQDKIGNLEAVEGNLMTGEDLSLQSFKNCVSKAVAQGVPDSLILLRDGDVQETEIDEFKKVVDSTGIKNCGIAWIKEMIPHRIFGGKTKVEKPDSGDYIPLDENNIMICCAGLDEYGHGMPKPRVVELTLIKGELDIIKISQDIFYQSYLNWGSPSHSYSSPAPLRLAHKLAYQLSKGLRRAGPPF